MSIRLRFVVLLSAIVGLAWLGRTLPELWQTLSARTNTTLDLSDTRRTTTYVLATTDELRFELPPQSMAVRILTNPNVRADDLDMVDEERRYRLGYQVLDDGERVALSGDYHKPVSVTRLQTSDSAATLGRNFYLDQNLVPLDAQMMRLKLDRLESEPTQLRLRLLDAPSPTRDVVVRVFALQSVPRSQQRFQWQRLDPREKTRRAQANVYPYRLLTSSEERDLVESLWTPLAPMGIEGERYATRDLYLRTTVGSRVRERPVLPQGLMVDAWSRGVFWVEAGTTRVRIDPLEPATDESQAPVRFWWQDSTTRERQAITRAWASHVDLEIGSGLLEVATPVPSLVRTYQLVADEEQELEPTLGLVRYYPSTSSTPVEYDVEHVGSLPTPFRVDMRVLADGQWDASSDATLARVRYQALDRAGAVVTEGMLDHPIRFSHYDHARSGRTLHAASERASVYFSLPARVTRLVLRAEAGTVLIAAFNRPPDLPRSQSIPEDTVEREPRNLPPPLWFAVRPRSRADLRQRDQSLLVYFQPRPEEPDANILAGEYFWQDFQPEGDWRGRFLLVPRDATGQATTREQGLPTTYRRIPPAREVDLVLAGRFNASTVEPTLLYFRDRHTPEDVVVRVDGAVVATRSMGGRSGELRLPPVAPGRHTVWIQSDPRTTWFLNHTVPGDEARYVRRLALQLRDGPLRVPIEKASHDAELLSFRLFLPTDRSTRTPVTVRLIDPPARDLAPLPGWTFTDRRYDLRPAGGGPVRVLETSGQVVDLGQRFFFVLNEDLAPGQYVIEVTVDADPDGYLTLTRTLPGRFEERHVFDD